MDKSTNNSSTAELLKYLKTNEFFKGFSDSVFHQLAEKAEWLYLNEGEPLFKRGDPSDFMYITVMDGLKIILKETGSDKTFTKEIQPDQIIGEIQFLTSGKRTADISAYKETKVIRLGKRVFECFGDEKHEFLQRLNALVRNRLQFDQLREVLPKLFGSLEKGELDAITERAEWIKLTRGETLFQQGDPGDSFYILISGRMGVAVEQETDKKAIEDHSVDRRRTGGRVVDQIKRGEIFGEMSLLTDDNRSGTVFAIRDSALFRFSKVDFNRLLEQYPKLLMAITKILVKRLRRTMESKRTEECSIVTVLPANQDTPLEDFTSRLAKELSSIYPTLHMNGKLLDQFLGTPGISQITEKDPNYVRVATWLNLQEQEYRFIILETDKTLSNWTKWCVRQADHILDVGEGTADPGLGEIEAKMLFLVQENSAESCSLVLLHPNGEKRPTGTRKWLEKRKVTMHHHVRWDSDEDFQRVARHLAGTSIGLAMGGGGARGFAHVGVGLALQEAGIPVDIIGGTSAGAIIAAFYAMRWDHKKIMSTIKANLSKISFDFTLPMTSLMVGAKMSEGLKDFFGEVCIEDLWLPYFCVSSNLSRAQMMVHRSGPLWKAILASSASPGIFPPVVLDGDLHVDGALLANLPSDAMNRLCNGKVIAVDVSPAVDLVENVPYGDSLSGWKILRSKTNPFADSIAIPGILSILQRAGELASIANQRRIIEKTSDLYLRMPVGKYKLADYGLAEQIIDTGYHFAKLKIEEWKRSGRVEGEVQRAEGEERSNGVME